MTIRERVIQEIAEVPEPLLDRLLNYLHLLKCQGGDEDADLALVSESSLKKDWLLPEEDEAWRDL